MYSTFISHLTDVARVYFFISKLETVASSNLCMLVCVWLDLHIWSTLPYLIRNRFGKMGNYCLSCGCLLFTYQINWSDMTDSWTVRRKNKRKLEITVWKFVFQTERLFASKIRAWLEMTKRESERESKKMCKATAERNEQKRKKQHEQWNIL